MAFESQYKVFYHSGPELTLKTTVLRGNAWIENSSLRVEGPEEIALSADAFVNTRLFRLHGLGRVIQLNHKNGTLFISVVRAMIGQFAFINFFKTGELFKKLQLLIAEGSCSPNVT